jgi:pyridoxamine 5'-phosphate oxidase family protein
MTLTDLERAYLDDQRLGRLATVAPNGAPQNSPVGFHYNADKGWIDIRGFSMGTTRKFRNVQSNPKVALVIDDIASVNPWRVRGVEIRATAEALPGNDGPASAIIRIHPGRVISWGLAP